MSSGRETLLRVCHQLGHLHEVFSATLTFLKAGVTVHLTLCSSEASSLASMGVCVEDLLKEQKYCDTTKTTGLEVGQSEDIGLSLGFNTLSVVSRVPADG